ncbi:hypothetical protein EYF80_060670 [Liparis tanakae]|uniref:Uncharacterized protein n=1 Tax=Liparis tanakae TaxID=230148 RepID=A0A4Z2ELE3_9TELE|nr:hypothetical protein EYF80_060670 [Liparis tanakae]
MMSARHRGDRRDRGDRGHREAHACSRILSSDHKPPAVRGLHTHEPGRAGSADKPSDCDVSM